MSADLAKSDDILCNNMRYHDFYEKKKNDLAFCWQMQGCVLPQEKVVDKETRLWRGNKEADCSLDLYKTRAGNSKVPNCGPVQPFPMAQGYDNYNNESLKDYLLIPCMQNTFRNHLSCDDKKCCSVRHQLFMNMTKRV